MGSLLDDPELTDNDLPVRCFEILWPQGPGAPDGDWCDITPYVVDFSTSRGRQYELDRFEAGQMTLTVETFDRLFDPNHVTGPFYPWLIPGRQIRYGLTWAGVYYPRWRGYIYDFGQTIEQDALYRTTIVANDGFERLEQNKLPSSAWAREIVKDSPSAWFRLGESDTPRLTDASENGNYGIYDNCDQGVEGLVVNDADGAAAFSHSTEERIYIQSPNLITGYPFTISGMFKIASLPDSAPVLFSGWPGAPAPAPANRIEISIDASTTVWASGKPTVPGTLVVVMKDGTNRSDMGSTIVVDDDRPHHFAWVATSSSDWKLYIDGVDRSGTKYNNPGTSAWMTTQPTHFVIGNYTDLGVGDFGFGTDVGTGALNSAGEAGAPGVIDEFCVWNGTAISATRIEAHSLAAKSGWDGDDSGARATRFLDAIDWPPFLRDIDSGISILGPASWSAGTSALSVLQDWAETELGAFFVDGSGRVIWRSRHYPLLDSHATSSQATFGDAHSAATLKCDVMELVRDVTQIRNPVTASRVGGVSVTVKDQTLIDDKHGDRTWASPATEDQKDSAVRDRAIWILNQKKDLGTRLKRLVLDPKRQAAAAWPVVLPLELGYRITCKQTPLGDGAETVVDQIIERISERGTRFMHEVEIVGSPVDPNVGDYLILDDATDGLLDTGVLAY